MARDGGSASSETVDPGTEEPITAVADGMSADIDRAVTVATDAFATWRDTDPVKRGQRRRTRR